MSQIDIPFIAVNNKGLELKNITKSYNNKRILDNIFCSDADSWRIANLRYFNPIGAHSSGLIGEESIGEPNNLFPYICSVANGKYPILKIFGNDWPTLDQTAIRDYIHVMDVADSHKLALDYILNNDPQCLNLNIGTGKGTSVLELVRIFEKVNKCKIPITYTERRMGDIPFSVADNSLALDILNWNPKRNVEEMCKDGWKWQQEKLK